MTQGTDAGGGGRAGTLLGTLAASVGPTLYDRDLAPELRARTTRMPIVHVIADGMRDAAAARSASP